MNTQIFFLDMQEKVNNMKNVKSTNGMLAKYTFVFSSEFEVF